jgi:hypothetical protein
MGRHQIRTAYAIVALHVGEYRAEPPAQPVPLHSMTDRAADGECDAWR